MSTAVLTLPETLDMHDGEAFSLVIDGVWQNGQPVVKHMSHRVLPETDRKNAVEQFLHNWTGAAPNMTDSELDDLRSVHLKEKHLK